MSSNMSLTIPFLPSDGREHAPGERGIELVEKKSTNLKPVSTGDDVPKDLGQKISKYSDH